MGVEYAWWFIFFFRLGSDSSFFIQGGLTNQNPRKSGGTIIQDKYSCYSIVGILKSASSQIVIPFLGKVFSESGMPWQRKDW